MKTGIDCLIEEEAMAFVKEAVPAPDVERYQLRDINRRFLQQDVTFEWVVDRKADVYLRWMGYDRQEPSEQYFSFCWKGQLLEFKLKSSLTKDLPGGGALLEWSVARGGHLPLPPQLEAQRDEIAHALEEALIVYRSRELQSRHPSLQTLFKF